MQSLTRIETAANAIAEAAREEGAREVGPLLKHVKGHFLTGTAEIALGTKYIAHAQHWVRGWLKFRMGALADSKIGRVADSFIVPAREDLNDRSEDTWEKGPDGKPKDPWTLQSYLPLEDPETGEILTFVSGSVGGRGAISTLCAQAARHMTEMGQPIIELATESYKHKTFGRIDKPHFKIVGWTNDVKRQPPAPEFGDPGFDPNGNDDTALPF